MIRHRKKSSESWKNTPWKKFHKVVFRLQSMIYKAVQAQDMARAKNLQKLLLRSYATDIKTNQKLFKEIGGKAKGNHLFMYDRSDLLPHPMIDPTEVSQGMSNFFWQS